MIYIVRDPRNVVTSFSNHFNINLNESAERMISDSVLGENTDEILTELGFSNDEINDFKEKRII